MLVLVATTQAIPTDRHERGNENEVGKRYEHHHHFNGSFWNPPEASATPTPSAVRVASFVPAMVSSSHSAVQSSGLKPVVSSSSTQIVLPFKPASTSTHGGTSSSSPKIISTLSSHSASSVKPTTASTSQAVISSSVSKVGSTIMSPAVMSSKPMGSSTSHPMTSSSVAKATATSTSQAATSTGSLSADAAAWVKAHNDFRAHYGAGPVTWNDTLASYASKYGALCKWSHSGGPYGENLAASTAQPYLPTAAFSQWSNEASAYNWSNPGFFESTGHFTQVVWKGTTQIGCSITNCGQLAGITSGTVSTNLWCFI